MAQDPMDTRLASLGLLLGAGMIGYSYWMSRKGVGPLSAGPVANATPGSVAGVGDLDAFARGHGLRLEGTGGDYAVLPQPGWSWDVNALAGDLSRQGYNATVRDNQVHVTLPK
jgi:hypothetical protein